VVAEIMRVIARLKAQGATILLVEQNARQALKAADEAFVLETGRVVLRGPAARLLDDEAVQRAFLGRRAKEN
jgi:branched-chain amino acid transport system ATP-binding protein